MSGVRMLNAGEQGLVVEFGDAIDAAVNARVHLLAKLLTADSKDGILEVVPTYRSLFVHFNPLRISRRTLTDRIAKLLSVINTASPKDKLARIVAIPVCYGGEFGPDLEFVAKQNNLSIDEVISIHTSVPYLIYMLGFTPGFPYLGGMSDKIAAPRLDQPRVNIPAGSVGIGGKQTGIYPVDSPGGWQLIGRTPLRIFDASAVNPFLFAAGDYLQFESIDSGEYITLAREAEAGRYSPVTRSFSPEAGSNADRS